MRTYCNKRSIYYLFFQNEIIGNEVNENIQGSIATSANDIPECLQRHKPLHRGIEIINNAGNKILHGQQK